MTLTSLRLQPHLWTSRPVNNLKLAYRQGSPTPAKERL